MAQLFKSIGSGIHNLFGPFNSSPTTTASSNTVEPITTTAVASTSSIVTTTPLTSSQAATSSSITTKIVITMTNTGSTATTATPSSTDSSSSSSSSPLQSQSSSSDLTQTTVSTSTTSTISTSTLSTTDSSSISSSSSTSSFSSSPSSSTSSAITSTITASSSSTTSRSTSTLRPTSTSTTIPAAPSAVSTNSGLTAAASSGSTISTTGIVIAIIFAAAVLISILWLIIRFCPPIRDRIDAWSERRRNNRSYRETLDGPPVPEKDIEAYSATSDKSAPREKYFSFFALGHNPQLPRQQQQPQNQKQQETIQQTYIPPSSALSETPYGHGHSHGHGLGLGLGLGRVSLLRNHSLLRRAGHDVPPHIPTFDLPVPSPAYIQPQQTPKTTKPVYNHRRAQSKSLPAPAPTAAYMRHGRGMPEQKAQQNKKSVRDVKISAPKLQVLIPGGDAFGVGERGVGYMGTSARGGGTHWV